VATSTANAIDDGSARLARAGCDTPRLDAELLLAEALGCDRAALYMRASDAVGGGGLERYKALVARREAREPVAYILGRRPFRRIVLEVDRRVLIPRPETELLVDVGVGLPPGALVADVGTGSGAVALALKDERPDLSVLGIDISEEAVSVARVNADRLGLDVSFVCGDLLPSDGQFDAVLANLPYVETGASLAPEISLYEPAGALFAGDDGLDAVRRLAPIAGAERVALLALEIGAGQADAVASLMADAGFGAIECRRDLAGIERVVVGRGRLR
jgi:release factor glutamine methyltransferase